MTKDSWFVNEKLCITSKPIRDAVNKMIDGAPEYFWHVAASSTGKYHPEYALGEGGLVRHVQAATRIAIQLFDIYEDGKLTILDHDIIIAALICHDMFKHGEESEENRYTCFDHPLIAGSKFETLTADMSDLDPQIRTTIANCIKSHMGKWNTNDRCADVVLPKPTTRLEKFVHMCDYLASRKTIEFKFNEPFTR